MWDFLFLWEVWYLRPTAGLPDSSRDSRSSMPTLLMRSMHAGSWISLERWNTSWKWSGNSRSQKSFSQHIKVIGTEGFQLVFARKLVITCNHQLRSNSQIWKAFFWLVGKKLSSLHEDICGGKPLTISIKPHSLTVQCWWGKCLIFYFFLFNKTCNESIPQAYTGLHCATDNNETSDYALFIDLVYEKTRRKKSQILT